MKKLLFTLLAVAVIAGTLVATCPGKEAHADAILTVFKNADAKKDGKKNSIAEAAAIKLLKGAVEDAINVDNYFIFSIGRPETSKDKKITFGILGKAYLLDKEALIGKKQK